MAFGFCFARATSFEITSVLNHHNEYLLLFTKDGFVVTRDKKWCNLKACPNMSVAEVTHSDNITEISALWNNSQVLGLDRIDASGIFRNPFNQMQFAIFLQIEDDDLSYLIVSLSLKRLFAFGNGADLFGSAWGKNSCLVRIIDIVSDPFEPATNYIICRETAEANSSLLALKASMDLANYHYYMLQPLNYSKLSEQDLQPVSSTFYLSILLPAYCQLGKGTIMNIELWNNELLLFHEHDLAIIRSNRVIWSGRIAAVFSPTIPERSIAPMATPAPNKLLNNQAFQMVQISIILFSFAFLLGFFYLLWVGITNLSDYFYEGVWGYSKEPVWLSKYDLTAN